ncbi:hypothetical protein Q5P01_015913 [Channa striata]|uniref:Uncharacterized protein n=1 Tax=Channa striata TaxID=64152 RepID=A0AA88ME51_CHASR|nr:hypothetical protein Q5P01_015913 [Channa striata]
MCGQKDGWMDEGETDIGCLSLLSSKPDPTGGEKPGVRSQSQQRRTGLDTAVVLSDQEASTPLTRLGLDGAPCGESRVSLL